MSGLSSQAALRRKELIRVILGFYIVVLGFGVVGFWYVIWYTSGGCGCLNPQSHSGTSPPQTAWWPSPMAAAGFTIVAVGIVLIFLTILRRFSRPGVSHDSESTARNQ